MAFTHDSATRACAKMGGLALARQRPDRGYTRAAQQAARRRRIADRYILQWFADNHPDLLERFKAEAEIELAREDHNAALSAKNNKKVKVTGK